MTEKLNLLIDEPFDLPIHGVSRADDGGAQVTHFQPAHHRVVATPLPAAQRQAESRAFYSTRVTPIRPDYERPLTAMTTYDHDYYVEAIAGHGLISEPDYIRTREDDRLRAIAYLVVMPLCALFVVWALVQLVEWLR